MPSITVFRRFEYSWPPDDAGHLQFDEWCRAEPLLLPAAVLGHHQYAVTCPLSLGKLTIVIGIVQEAKNITFENIEVFAENTE